MNTEESNQFIKTVSEEKKRLYDLKFSLYIKGYANNHKGGWISIIHNIKDEKIILNGKNNNTNEDRMSLYAIVEACKHILKDHTPSEKKHVKISCYTDNIYCTNVIKEWIKIWKKEKFNNRPNRDLLLELSDLLSICNFNVQYSQLNYSSLRNEFESIIHNDTITTAPFVSLSSTV